MNAIEIAIIMEKDAINFYREDNMRCWEKDVSFYS